MTDYGSFASGAYDEDNVPTGAPAPDGGQQKQSQAAVHYRKGSPVKACGLCTMFEGAAHGTCTDVDGQITPFGVCDIFKIKREPWPLRELSLQREG
jgi:hypothetical protein